MAKLSGYVFDIPWPAPPLPPFTYVGPGARPGTASCQVNGVGALAGGQPGVRREEVGLTKAERPGGMGLGFRISYSVSITTQTTHLPAKQERVHIKTGMNV